MDELLEQWRDPVFRNPHWNVPASLAARLTEMADELLAGESVAQAIANATIPDAPDDILVTPLRHAMLPRSLRVYYERMHSLLAVAALAGSTELPTIRPEVPPSDAEKRVDSVIGQAFHQGCSLADVALAAGLPEDQVLAIGKRTIKRTGWLKRI